MREHGGGRIIQISSYGGQTAFAGNSLYHATKWGIERFCESVAQEVAPFAIGVTIVEPGGARTEFRYGSAQVADPMPEYDGNPAHAFQTMLDPAHGLAPGDPARMAGRIIESVDQEPAPLRMIFGSQALETTIEPSSNGSPASKPRPSWPPRRTSRSGTNDSRLGARAAQRPARGHASLGHSGRHTRTYDETDGVQRGSVA